MREPSSAIQQMGRSGIREIFDLANTIPDALHLEMAEPDFPTPAHIVEAAHRAAVAGVTTYTPNAGIPELREALADKIATRNGVEAAADRVVVTPGAIAALFSSFLALCDPGDQVLIPDPGWPNYAMIATMQRLDAVRYPLRFDQGFTPDPETIERLITPKTKAILLNSPSNPTGAILEGSELATLLELAADHDLWVISDEVYDEIVFDRSVAPAAAAHDPDRVVTVWSFSKTYSMTGWRVGYALAPRSLSSLLVKTQEPTTACVNGPAQMAALEAVTGPQSVVAGMVSEYRTRRDAAVGILTGAGIPHSVPSGAFYLWIDVSGTGISSADFCRRLLHSCQVAVTPGSAFGRSGEGFVRVSLASETGLLTEGIGRLATSVEAWSTADR
ncbi:MAG TPA: pyridoxal phosphate-dependent aminotransferase [Acidimicrobiia bacterium]|nr:pyridoxal phosphate-dependent aminotransferase [Acidimicrobiia bacterium]